MKPLPEEIEYISALACDDPIALMATGPEVLGGLSPLCRQVAEALLRATNTDWPRWEQGRSLLRASDNARAEELLMQAIECVPTRPVEELVNFLTARSRLRHLKEASLRVVRMEDGDPIGAVGSAESILAAALTGKGGPTAVTDGLGMVEAFLRAASERAVLIPSGIPIVDEVAGGWRRGGLHLVAGLSGHGKSAFLVQTAVRCAGMGHRVYIASAEMDRVDLAPRVLAEEARCFAADDGSPITSARLSRLDPPAVEVVPLIAERMRDILVHLLVDDEPTPDLGDLIARVCRFHFAGRIDLVLVDYQQLVRTERRDTREQEVREVSVKLKDLARRLRCAVVLATQLLDPPPWAKEVRESPRGLPIRESRAAFHDADLAIELYKDLNGSLPGSHHVRYRMRIHKSRQSGAELAECQAVFDRRTCRFLWEPP